MAKKRVNIMLSEEVLRDLREMVPARKRSQFVEEVVADGIRRAKFDRALEILRSGGGLKAEDYPHWATLEDVQGWIREMRSDKGRRAYLAKVHEESIKYAEEREKKGAEVSSR